MAHLVDEMTLPGFDFYAWDARGHGQSPGERGYSPSFGTSVRDVQAFVDHITALFQREVFQCAARKPSAFGPKRTFDLRPSPITSVPHACQP